MKKSKVYKKICAFCREEFDAHDKRQVYCCHSCRTQAYNFRISQNIHLAEFKKRMKAEIGKLEEEKVQEKEEDIKEVFRREVLKGIGNALATYIIKK